MIRCEDGCKEFVDRGCKVFGFKVLFDPARKSARVFSMFKGDEGRTRVTGGYSMNLQLVSSVFM